MDATSPHDPKDVTDNKDLAALGYVWVLSLVVLFARRESPFVQFHARQGAVLFGLSLVVWAAPFVGKLLEVLILALCVMGFLQAAQGQWKEVPIVGPLSRGSVGDLRSSWKDVVAALSSLWARLRTMMRPPDETTPAPDPTPPAAASSPSPPAAVPLAPPIVPGTPSSPPPDSETPPSVLP